MIHAISVECLAPKHHSCQLQKIPIHNFAVLYSDKDLHVKIASVQMLKSGRIPYDPFT
jgi:hypothetical protein